MAETEKFDEEHYLADLFDPPEALLTAHQFTPKVETSLTDAEKTTLMSIKSSIGELDGSQVVNNDS